jgi:signal transduction histidine kinase
LDFAISDHLAPVWCDPDQIREVLLNLIANSYQAAASVVQVKIEQDADGTWFRIIDDGKGVAAGADPFAPLYSTKQNGSGLGLAITRRIVVDHGGEISFQDNPTGGAVFKFYLPGGSS